MDILPRGLSRLVVVSSVVFLNLCLSTLSFASAPEPHLGPVLHGVLRGEVSVGASGEAGYSIPVQAPPGTSGMAPNLSIDYNSRLPNGLLGMGWFIAGLDSAIARCPQTIAQDGQSRAVDLTANDRFCLEGERLLLISGTYGVDGAEYRTEKDRFSRIVSHGATTGNPDYWTVEQKDGLTLTYGGTSDSRLEAPGETEHVVWYPNKTEDELGNYYTISYTRPATITTADDSYIRPDRIDYTGNSGQSLSPYASVRFEYETRTDGTTNFSLSGPILIDQRLSHIKTFVGATQVMEYQFSYDTASSTGRSRLTSLTQCTPVGDCTLANQFTWSDDGTVLSGIQDSGDDSIGTAIIGDFNGDGQMDVLDNGISCFSGDAKLYHAGANGDLTLVQTIDYQYLGVRWSGFCSQIHTGDFNGDGRTDLLMQGKTAQWGIHLLLADANGQFHTVHQNSGFPLGFSHTGHNTMVLGDYNGDGRTDVFSHGADYGKGDYLVLADSDGKFTSVHQSRPFCSNCHAQFYQAFSGDFNGDGQEDILLQRLIGNGALVYLSDEEAKFNGFVSVYSTTTTPLGADRVKIILGDYNGDGRTDILAQPISGPNDMRLFLADEHGHFPQSSQRQTFATTGWSGADIYPSDFNGDGRTDLFVQIYTDARIHLSQPDGTITDYTNAHQTLDDEWGINWDFGIYDFVFADFDGDGRSDFLIESHGTDYQMLRSNDTEAFPDQLTDIDIGFGTQISFEYTALTDDSIYTKGSTATYPQQDSQTTGYVVSTLSQADGLGGMSYTNYTYDGLVRDLEGRGELGFAKITAVAVNHNITTITEYEQDFPSSRLPNKIEIKRTSDSRLLSSEENTYSIFGNPATDPIFPYVGTKVEKTYDLGDGRLLSTKTTLDQYDAYGNLLDRTETVDDHENNQTFETQTTSTFNIDTTNWWVGQTLTETIMKSVDSVVDPTLGSSIAYTYDSATGQQLTLTRNPNAGAPTEFTETHTYDGFGNIISQTLSGPGLTSSTNNLSYDSRGQFPVTVIDPLNNHEDRVYDDHFGVMTSLTDNNYLTTTWQYDGFGQITLETRPDNSTTATAVHLDNSSTNPNAEYYTEVLTSSVNPVRTFEDRLGRTVRLRTQDSNDDYNHEDTEYDNRGRIYRISETYVVGNTVNWNTYTYDDLGREISFVGADTSANRTTSYDGFSATVTDGAGNSITWIENAIGQTIGILNDQETDVVFASVPASDGDGSYSLSWSAGSNIYSSYTLEEQLDGGSWTIVQNTSATSASLSGKGNGVYGYRVKGCIGTFCGGYTSLETVDVAIAPGTPTSIDVSPTTSANGSHTVSWSAAGGSVSNYELEQSLGGGSYVNVYTGATASHNLSSLVDGSYVYRVRACRTTGSFTNCGAYQSSTSVTVANIDPPGLPQNLTVPATDNDGNYSVSWTGGSGIPASTYTLQEQVDGGSWTTIQSASGTSAVLSGKGGGTYGYRVNGCNAGGCSAYTATQSVAVILPPGTPGAIQGAGTNATGDYTLSWSAATGTVSSYTLEQQFNSGAWVVVQNTNELDKDFSGKGNGFYNYRVKACNTTACGAYTAVAQVHVNITGGTTEPPLNPPTPYVATPPAQTAAEVVASDLVGATAGQFRVDESGSATYSIPIATVAGTAGVAPKISLNYSSQGGNGLLGKGWNISGLSGITRCRQTLQQDGQAKPISWSNQDRFCLDGQRLIKVSGTYGSPGSTYKTEIDSFAKITAKDGSAGHPAYFTVERKDGSVSTYGNTTDSKQKAGSTSKVLTWAQNKFEDSVGNEIRYVYSNDSDGQRINLIYYAYGGLSTSQTYLDFDYEPRVDDIGGYVGGYQFQTTQRLKTIKSYNNGTQIRKYNLTYLATPTGNTANKISKLDNIQECRESTCLSATSFTWAADQIGFNSSFTQSTLAGDAMGNYRPADINGDGKMDLVWTRLYIGTEHVYYRLRYALSDGSKLTDIGWEVYYGETKAGSRRKPREWDILDYNGDGRTDVAIKNPTGYTYEIYLSEPQADGSWQLATSSITTPSLGVQTAFVDIDSDGLTEALYVEPNGTKFYTRDLLHDTSQGIGSNRYYKFGSASQVSRPWPEFELIPGNYPNRVTLDVSASGMDFNGDGLTDAAATYYYYFGPFGFISKKYALVRDGSGYSLYGEIPDAVTRYGDFNGDGLTDIYYRTGYTNNYQWAYAINNSAGFSSGVALSGLNNVESLQLSDYNQDGYPDFIWHNGSGWLNANLWNPATAGFNATTGIKSVTGGASYQHLVLDVNGDGSPDYARVKTGAGGFIQVYPNNGIDQPRNVITKITNGLAADTDITYGSLSNSGHYERITVGTTSQTSQFCWYQSSSCQNYTHTVADTDGFYSALNGDWDIPAGSHTFGKGKGPVLELNGPIYVVTEAKSDAPVAGNVEAQSHINYYYGEAKLQASGRGFLGFHKIKSVDEQTGVETTTTYRQDFPFIGYPSKTEVHTSSGKLLSEAENIWKLQGWSGTNTPAPYRPYIATSTEKTYSTSTNLAVADKLDVSTTVLQTVTTNNTYDAYGNPLTINVTTTGGGDTFTKNTTNVYGSSTYEKEKGRLSRTTVLNTRNGQSETRVSAFNYYTAADGDLEGLLKDEIIEPDDPAYTLTTSYEYDRYGNKVKATQSGQGVSDRFTEWVYDKEGESESQGRYLKQTKNAYGQITEQVIDRNEYGAPTQVQNIDGVNTYIYYSKLGREYFRHSDTGAWSQTLSALGSSAPNGKYQVTTTQAGGGEAVEHFDRLGRSVRTASRSFDGSWIYQDTEYDNLGRVKRVTQPYFANNTQYWTDNDYDILGRVIQTSTPDNDAPDGSNDSSIAYSGLTTTYTNDKLQNKTETKNVLGELVTVVDHYGGKIDYSYDPLGNMEQLVATGTTSSSGLASGAPGTITTTLHYDLLGRKIKMVDPDKGTWHYHYNVFGELTAQLDAKNQCSVITYDLLGRQLTRKDFGEDSQIASVANCATSSGNLEGNTSWVYNNAISPFVSNGLGQLRDVVDLVSGYIKMIGYDYYGRPEETVTSLGVSGVDGDHYEKVTYDQFGRTFQVYDAARDTDDYGDNAIEYRYNSYGYLHQVVDAVYINSQTRSTYYEVLEMDERGNVKKELLGNGYTTARTYDPKTGRLTHIGAGIGATLNTIQDIDYQWDQLGNLTERHTLSGSKDIEETFDYDGLNRLTRAEVTGGDYTITSFDAYGNIKDKNTYDSTGAQNTNASVGTYTYDGPSGGPHAVTATTLGNLTYQYDANGNLTQNDMADGDTRTIQYTTFDKPGEIVKGNHKTEFEYGPDRARYKRIDTNTSNSEVTTTLYIGSVEKITNPDGTKAIKRYINGVAIVTQNYDSGNSLTSTDTRYLYKDHLGSMDFITDEFGTIQQEMSFDAWGKRRNAVDWESLSLTLLFNFDSSNTTRGFTGHEMLDEVGLVHMNGRIYDPHIGRFVQADPFVQVPSDTQMLNRYSYTRNNPLNATDPSGYFIFTLGAIALAAGGVVEGALAIGILFGVAGFADALVQGASFGEALKSGIIAGISGAAFSYIGGSGWDFIGGSELITQSLAYGVIGGITSVLQGGKFGHGFVSAGLGGALGRGLGKLLQPVLGNASQLVSRMVVGGTLSEATGGKFANGAAYAAFAYIANSAGSAGAGAGENGGFSFRSAFRSIGQSLGLVPARTGIVTVEEILSSGYGETSTQEAATAPAVPRGRLPSLYASHPPSPTQWAPSANQGRGAAYARNAPFARHAAITVGGSSAIAGLAVLAVDFGVVVAANVSRMSPVERFETGNALRKAWNKFNKAFDEAADSAGDVLEGGGGMTIPKYSPEKLPEPPYTISQPK